MGFGAGIGARQIPDNSPGVSAVADGAPYKRPVRSKLEGEVYNLNPGLVNWAVHLIQQVSPADSGAAKAGAREVHRLPSRHEAAVRRPREHVVGEHLSGTARRLRSWRRVDALLHRGQRQLHDCSDGRLGPVADAHFLEPGRPRGLT